MYDVMVIGGGPAGYQAAEKAALAGKKTLLFEAGELGGVCLNEGCVPSKTLLHSAKLYDQAKKAKAYGVLIPEVGYDQKAVITRKKKVVRTLVAGVRGKMKQAGVTMVAERACITGANEDSVTVRAGEETYVGKFLIVATGSHPVIPPIPGAEGNPYLLTNRQILELTQIPQRLTVIGGGVIGLEMAAYYGTVGSQVTVVELLDHIGGNMDRQLSALLQTQLEKKGIRFLLGHRCAALEGGTAVVVGPDGQTQRIEGDHILISVGRKANVEGLGLENANVQFTAKGIPTDLTGRTNVPRIFAVGDVNGHHMLAHTAYREAEVAVNTILGQADAMRYHANPAVIYTSPEVAWVGRTEEECREKGIGYRVKTLSMRHSGRFIAENEGGDGLCKIIADEKRGTILGIHLLGGCASELIWGAAAMLETQLRVTDARQIIFPHPTVSEVIRETLWQF